MVLGEHRGCGQDRTCGGEEAAADWPHYAVWTVGAMGTIRTVWATTSHTSQAGSHNATILRAVQTQLSQSGFWERPCRAPCCPGSFLPIRRDVGGAREIA